MPITTFVALKVPYIPLMTTRKEAEAWLLGHKPEGPGGVLAWDRPIKPDHKWLTALAVGLLMLLSFGVVWASTYLDEQDCKKTCNDPSYNCVSINNEFRCVPKHD